MSDRWATLNDRQRVYLRTSQRSTAKRCAHLATPGTGAIWQAQWSHRRR